MQTLNIVIECQHHACQFWQQAYCWGQSVTQPLSIPLQVQVGQLALTNDRMQSLQQRDADHQGVLQECQTLRAALLEMETLLSHARSRQAQAEQDLGEVRAASTDAAAAAEQEREELQRTCVGLQHHLAGRKAIMEACTRLLQAACPQ